MIVRTPRISTKKRNALIKCFVQDKEATIAAQDCRVSIPCANRWYRHFRELIYMSGRRAPRFFGEVEMDQSEFGGRGRKRMQELLKRYAKILPHSEYMEKAREIRREHKVMVFAILQRGGNVYAQIIEKADRRTLAPIVRLVVEQGSTVYTDKWRAFNELGIDGYTHKNINHSESYSDKNGVHINGIEAFWSFAKRRLRKFNGIARTTLPLHIQECAWRYNHEDIGKALKLLLDHHQNPFPLRRSDKNTSPLHPKSHSIASKPQSHHTSRTDNVPSSGRARRVSVRRKAWKITR